MPLERPPSTWTKRRNTPFTFQGIMKHGTKMHVYPYGRSENLTKTGLQKPMFLQGTQVTTSENHPSWKKRKKGRYSGDVGGPFFTNFRGVRVHGQLNVQFSGERVNRYPSGQLHSTDYFDANAVCLPTGALLSAAIPNAINSSNSTLDAWGTKAIAQCKPTNNVADLSVFLGETIKEGIPRMIGNVWKDVTKSARKKAAEEYLSVQFGWLPIVNDVLKTSNAIANADRVIDQYIRDSGKIVRRRMAFPPVVLEDKTTLIGDGVDPYVSPNHVAMSTGAQPTGKVYMREQRYIYRWFSGAFTYYIPDGGSSLNGMRRSALEAKKLLGLSPTPDTFWNLAPWSWAVDWFTNAGDFLSNVTDWIVDGLVLRYGYIMETSISQRIYFYSGKHTYTAAIVPPVVSIVNQTKIRRRATPFGFGLTWSGLSGRQLSIIAALGLTKFG